ncbi:MULTISPECIES: PspC domain-containing protein [unclassified Gordonia (in: high G+C Gram-positive bacteria)]|uniref:PspC domain-containing protein n=1 Tax=unclassified Gordonia (in: high G+C Gram-positive bacteria) TaxID=2657482 RepID=UPI001F0E0516|nr:PspC domain-containing protein [Gordonia sp. ABSL49_1]MCH5643028.1 PspC domain-containing protein [Gordonia sp. ABSL49_1]
MTSTIAPVNTAPTSAPERRLTRSRTDAWFGGVCGGIAARWDLDPTLVRALFVVSILLPGPQVLVYLALWLVIPREPVRTSPETTVIDAPTPDGSFSS